MAEACDDGGLISFGDDQCSNQKEVSDDLQRQIDRLNQEVNDLDRAIEKTTSDVSINNEARINPSTKDIAFKSQVLTND